MDERTTVGQYVIHRLDELGVRHVFGVPGDYVLRFYDMLVASNLKVVGTCTELGAGFAADAYARVNGLGAVCITYCVGGFNMLNSVAGAYAEKSPVVVLSGAPGLSERGQSPLLHHRVRGFNTQRRVFERVTAVAVALEDPVLAPRQIDDALRTCLRRKRPVYMELPRDVVNVECAAPQPWRPIEERSDPGALAEAVAEASAMLRKARRPVILAGVEIHRFGLQRPLLRLVEKSGFPVAGTLLGKSMIQENHPQYIGIYEGAMGRDDVRRVVEGADCVLILGAFLTDIDLGIDTAHLELSQAIHATAERIAIRHHAYDDVSLGDFIEELAKADLGRPRSVRIKQMQSFNGRAPQPKKKITVTRFFERMNAFLDEDTIVISDIGDSLFGAADLIIRQQTEFISPAYYTSMGFAVPAAIGAQVNRPRLRPLVFVGDGAFQMTGQELSTIAKLGLNPVVFVLNNQGYGTERVINEGPYNDIHEWAFHKLTELLRAGWSAEVWTEGDLEAVLQQARERTDTFGIVNVHLGKYDSSRAMARLGKRLSKRVAGAKKR